MVKASGTPEQAEEAYAALASHFPADARVWVRLGDARFAAEKDAPALDVHRRATKADPESADARQAAERVEDVLRVDPTRRGFSVRERARRWDEILQRVLVAAAACGTSPEIEKGKTLVRDPQTRKIRQLFLKRALPLPDFFSNLLSALPRLRSVVSN